ncbi:MAG: aspartate carbamoyltransferase, partial [Treponema sp.]|nr:aspartate carbamoyltransferase [Treponema sp.]
MKGRHLIEPGNFTIDELDKLFSLAETIMKNPDSYSEVCRGKVLATLFFEPSTRTRLSFEAAMLRLGGSTLGFAEPGASSTSKGESLADTIRTVASYVDIIAMRNPKEGAALLASQYSDVPVINAGDGGHHHPTQTLTDLLTIRTIKKKMGGLTIGLCGDLKFGRTVHSLAKAMSRYPGNRFALISPPELEIPDYIISRVFKPAGVSFSKMLRLEDVIGDLDILYMTRVQKERFFNEQDYIRLKDSYILDTEKMRLAKKDLCVLHPLPRVNEISPEVDSDPRAAYFQQVKFGMYAR